MTTLLAISGSLRSASWNTRLLRALSTLAPQGVKIVHFNVSPLPFYNQDLDEGDRPVSVDALRAAVDAADGVIFVTPEYNHSIPAVTKNAIDWLSRPFGNGHLRNKNVAIFVASIGPTSGSHCVAQTKDVVELLENNVVAAINIGGIHEKLIERDGVDVLAHEETANVLRDALSRFTTS